MKLTFFSLSLFDSSFGSEAVTIASLKSGEGQELSSTSWREGSIYVYYLEFFCKEDLSLLGIYFCSVTFILVCALYISFTLWVIVQCYIISVV